MSGSEITDWPFEGRLRKFTRPRRPGRKLPLADLVYRPKAVVLERIGNFPLADVERTKQRDSPLTPPAPFSRLPRVDSRRRWNPCRGQTPPKCDRRATPRYAWRSPTLALYRSWLSR